MQQFFGNAAYINTGASETPFGLVQRLLYKIDDDNIEAMFVGFESSS